MVNKISSKQLLGCTCDNVAAVVWVLSDGVVAQVEDFEALSCVNVCRVRVYGESHCVLHEVNIYSVTRRNIFCRTLN